MINPYAKWNYRLFILVPVLLFLVFLFLIFVYPTVPKGIELSGGTIIRISLDKPVDIQAFKSALSSSFSLSDLAVNTTESPLGQKLLIQFSYEEHIEKAKHLLDQAKSDVLGNPANSLTLSQQAVAELSPFFGEPFPQNVNAEQGLAFAQEAFNKADQEFSTRLNSFLESSLGLSGEAKILKDEVGAALGESFYQNAILVSVIAFFFISIVIFAMFREIVPSVTMLASALFDVATALALMAVFSIPLTLSTIPALLTVVGYSVDTEILLTTQVVKRKDKNVHERALDAISTGIAMTTTILATLLIMIAISFFGQISVMFEISVVLFFGLLADIVSTWMMSAPLILLYVESKGRGEK